MDDVLGETTTDTNGNYNVYGHTREISTINPFVDFFHKCGCSKVCIEII